MSCARCGFTLVFILPITEISLKPPKKNESKKNSFTLMKHFILFLQNSHQTFYKKQWVGGILKKKFNSDKFSQYHFLDPDSINYFFGWFIRNDGKMSKKKKKNWIFFIFFFESSFCACDRSNETISYRYNSVKFMTHSYSRICESAEILHSLGVEELPEKQQLVFIFSF